ncbi:MAG TPA: segregation/condensation protein A [Candidatus Limnocylindrales bacterium]|jgi:segregation and condensation protein A
MLEIDAATVEFGPGRGRAAVTHVRVESFEGPLGLLLNLIESRQLDILTVSLGSLAGAYLEALAGLETDRIGNVSGFVAVAGQLILIKSRAMLPRGPEARAADSIEDEVDPEAELRARLLLYRAYRDAGNRLQLMALERIGLFRRDPGVAAAAGRAGADPMTVPTLDVDSLPRALNRLLRLVPPAPPPPGLIARTITIAERAEMIRAALRNAPVVVLQELLRGVRDRVVRAITFLAMLELVKRREIVVEQAEPWGPIVARRTSPAERSAGGTELEPAGSIDETLEDFR